MDHVTKKYHVITDELVLFNDEYYVTVLRVSLDSMGAASLSEIFNELYAFSHADVELEIDISEEQQGTWYLQFLVPYMLTLSDTAIKRITRGSEALQSYLDERSISLNVELLRGSDIFAYMKRYNPGLAEVKK
ncbi:hypothetical protein EDM56_17245 [Brevibacillus fluminis]|uniref:Uncharacterized protein n=1 Tax=Brevibacillus fluminis TaxID=511487 RepID=A0A3M8DH46_9BACL|nr:hypothetical protein [Brevibacillus fluminis]RNB87403.1 hypothetical protein EDM56_17245 [Brevibacillus fluminis]